jgi:hypothetical protein
MEIIAKRSFYNLLFLLLFVFVIPFCQSPKDDPLFVGTWQFKEAITTDDLVFNTTRTLTLTKKSYEETYVIVREDEGKISAIIGLKGDLVISHYDMTFMLKELGTCVKDASNKCTGNVQWNGQSTQYWIDNISYFELVVKGDFDADETSLRLKRDMNNDGDIDDTGEDIEFERI